MRERKITKEKKALIIAYYFPPAGGSAVQRILKFVKYLPQYGWQPVVLTAREKDYDLRDNSLCDEIPPGAKIYRTPVPDLYQLYEQLGKKSNNGTVDISTISVKEGSEQNFLKRIALFVRSFFFIPDARIGWLPTTLWVGQKIIRKEKIDLIFVSAPPFTATLIGGILGKLTGLPWVSDYRDPWTQAYFYFPRPAGAACFESSLENRLLHWTNRIVTINQPLFNLLSDKYGSDLQKKGVIIPNGFDPEDFMNIKPHKDSNFTITYTGTLNAKMEPSTFLTAVQNLCKQDPRFSKHVKIRFIGRVGEDVKELIHEKDMKDQIHFLDHLPHAGCLQYMLGSDMLLLLIPEDKTSPLIMTGKLFEYLKSGNPILCLSENSIAAEIVRETQAGWTVAAKDVERIQSIVKDAFTRWGKGQKLITKPVRKELINRFDRKKAAEKLANLFDEIIQQKQYM